MDHVEAVGLMKRYYATAYRKGWLIASRKRRTIRFRETCEVEERLRKQIIDAMVERSNDGQE